MPMPPTGFPRLALFQAAEIHYDGDHLIILDKLHHHLLTIAFAQGIDTRPANIYHHERRTKPVDFVTEPLSNIHTQGELSNDH